MTEAIAERYDLERQQAVKAAAAADAAAAQARDLLGRTGRGG